MFNEDLILVCKGIWAKKDEIKQHIEDNKSAIREVFSFVV